MRPFVSRAQERWMFANKPTMAKEWASKMPKGAKLPLHVKKKAKISINNKMKGNLGQMDTKTNKIEINVKAHKGDKAELASTVKHELLHVKHPKMTEKEVYKASAKTKIDPDERRALLARLRGARITKTANALRKKYKVEGSEPGAIYQKANAQKPIREKGSNPSLQKIEIMGIM